MSNFSTNALMTTSLFLCSLLCKGVPREQWDPLPAGVRSVVSSNHLGEATPPQVFAEYHALLPTYRGDYGVRSELVDAASEEPIYKGAETILLPLYIPRGAVPLSVNERRVRSGKMDGIANMRILRGPSPSVRDSSVASTINRPVRRVLPPARRPPSGSRPLPTPPAAYLRPWLKRMIGATPSDPEQDDNVEEAKRSKQKLLTEVATLRKRGEVSTKDEDSSSSTESVWESLSAGEAFSDNEKVSAEKRNKESVRIKKIMKRIGTRSSAALPATHLRPIAEPLVQLKNTSHESSDRNSRLSADSTENYESDAVLSSDEQDSNSSSPPSPPPTPTNVTLTSLPSSSTSTTTTTTASPVTNVTSLDAEFTSVKPNVFKIIRRRPVVMNKPYDEFSRTRMRPVVPARNTEDASSSDEEDTNITKSNITETATIQAPTPSTSKSIIPSLRQKNSSHIIKPIAKTPDWLQRRRESILRERDSSRQGGSQSSEKKDDSESIIDRVLNSAASRSDNESVLSKQVERSNFNNPLTKERSNSNNPLTNKPLANLTLDLSNIRSSLNRRKAVLNRNTNDTRPINSNKEGTKEFYPLHLTATEIPSLATSLSLRQRIPLRLRRPMVSNPVKPTTSTSTATTTTTTTSTPSTTSSLTTATSTTKDISSFTTFSPEEPILLKRTVSLPFLRSLEEDAKPPPKGSHTTNFITTSTPKLPINFPIHSSPKPKRHNAQANASSLPIERIRDSSHGTSQPLRFTPAAPLPRMKSPQDIVLDKLSELMKNATRGGRDNLEMIIEEIEKLNKELASMGIHIIDAEFDGHKIKLKDQIETNGSGVNLSGATTIRYVIPNINGRSRTRNLQPEIISHDDSRGAVPRVHSSIPSGDDQVQIKLESSSTPKPHYFTTLKPDTKFFTLRHRNKSTANVVLTSPLPSVSVTVEELSFSRPSSEEGGGSNESAEIVNSNVFLKSGFDSDRDEISSEVSATTTQSSSETTRTRSPTVSIDTSSSIESISDEGSQILSYVNHNQKSRNYTLSTPSIETTSVNPTAHLRPAISKDAPETFDSKLSTSTSTTTTFTPITATIIAKGTTITTTTDNQGVTSEQPSTNEIWGEGMQRKAIDGLENPFPLLISEQENILGSELSEDPTTEESSSYIYLIGILGVVPCLAALAILYKQRHKREKKSLPEREERAEGLTPPTNHARTGHNDTLDAFPGYIFESSPQRDSPWELSRSKLRLTSVIGEGNFGIVWKAEARNLCDWDGDGGPTVLVAVKGVKEGAGPKEKSDLLRELSIMQHLSQHSNIVTLLGCCTTQEPYLLVMEYVMFGKLLTFLREQRSKNNCFNFSSDLDHLTSRDLTKFACQITTGCEYLQSRGVIHRDLAARNILVDHNKVCKIADFGLARSVKDMDNDIYEQKSKGPLPIRWMAPESLFMNIFTHKSDVWSFGILCWEIVTLGSTPYPGISAREVMRRVREGYRLERPEHCRPEFYRIVTKCWHQDLNKRASFTTVKEEIKDLLENYAGWIDLENFQDSTYYSMHENNDEKL